MIRTPRACQRALPSAIQFPVRLAFMTAVLATVCGFPSGTFAADPVTKSFTDSLGRTALYRYSLKDGWDPTQPRGLLVNFHGNNTGTQQDMLNFFHPNVEHVAYQHDLVPVVVASPEARPLGAYDGIYSQRPYRGYGTRIWTDEDRQLVHELLQSQFGGDFSVDFGRIVFWGGSAGSAFLYGFVRSYGENYGGGLLAWCGAGIADPFWRPTQQFRERFRVLVTATTEDFQHIWQTGRYGYYKYTLGFETRGDLQVPGGHCRAGAYSWETAVGWLLDGTGIPEEPVEPHFERTAVFDYVAGLTVDGAGTLWVVRQTPAQEDAAIWRSVDRGTTWEAVSRVQLIVADIDAVGDALFLIASTPSNPYSYQLYRSLDGGLNFTVAGGTDNPRLYELNEPLLTDPDGKLYVMGRYTEADWPDVYVSDDLGESWTSLGLPREARYDRITNPDGIWTEQSGLIVVSDLPASPFSSSFSSAVGKTEGNDWRVLADTPAGQPYSIAWDGSSIWGVVGLYPYSVSQSSDLGSTWLETELPSDPALSSTAIQRVSALNENQQLLFGGGGNVFLRDGGGVWHLLHGGATLGEESQGWSRGGTIGQTWDARITLDPSSGDVFATDGKGIFRLDAENRALSNVGARPDIDRDGVPDMRDAFPSDPAEYLDTDGDGIGNHADSDADGDGVADIEDGAPLDRYEVMDTDGDGVGDGADLDDDGDEVLDVFDEFPLDKQENADTDGDRIGDRLDADDDGDGVNDLADAFPRYPREWLDTDGDGIGDNLDSDDDNDGLADDADPDPLDGPEKPGFLRPADHFHQLLLVIGSRDDRFILPVHPERPSQFIYPDDLGDAPSFGYIRLGDQSSFEIQFAVDEYAWRGDNNSLAKVYFDRNGNGDLTDDGPPSVISPGATNSPGIRIWPLEVPYASGEVVPYGISIDGASLGYGGSTTAGSRISSVPVNFGGSWVGDVAAPNGSMTLVQTVDYDIDGVFNRSPEDFVCIDVDGDRGLDCGPDGAERFRHEEPFTLDGQQVRALVAASGHRVELVLAESPGFDPAGGPGDQTYTGGIAIGPLTLPTASGGDGALTYSLTPAIPGLSFDAARRQLTGTPTSAGTYNMTYTATDADGDTDTRNFTITVMAPVTPPGTGTVGTESFSIPNLGGWSTTSSGTESAMRSGYGRIRAESGSTTPSGIAIFGFRQGGVLIAEAGVPASEPVQEGRIFAESSGTPGQAGSIQTGLAMANPNDAPATILFYFRDAEGERFGDGQLVLGAYEQTAKFLNDAPFNSGELESGTFTFTSSVPIAVIALRGLTNRDGEFLMTTLPVAPLATPRTPFSGNTGSADTVYFPHFTDGDGWVTQVILVNPTDRPITGTVRFLGPGSGARAASPAVLTLDDDRTGSEFPYSIPAGSSQKFTTSNPTGGVTSGSVRATPTPGSVAPSGLVVFSYTSGGKTVSESGVPALPAGSAFRVYAESSGTPNQPGSIRTGLAITNAADTTNMVTLEVTDLDGNLATGVASVPLTLPPSGQVARFLDEIFDSLPNNFTGVLRVTSTADVAIVGLRLRYNEKNELKMTTTPPSDETDAPTMADRFFPHIVDSAGWSTQFILFSGVAGQTSSGTLSFIDTAGEPWNLPTTNGVSGSLPPGGGTVADLVVASASVSDASPEPGESFTFSATVRNQGSHESAATMLRYYRSTDATITRGDTEVGTDAVSALTPAGTSDESISLTAPTTAGTYYYGACVDPVSGESDTGNNCSNSSMGTVSSASMAVTIPDANLRAAIEAALGKTNGATITAADMETLTTLSARNAGISDLTGLEFATNLTELQLDYNRRISDVSSLAGLTNLTELYLRFNTITDVSSLEALTKLTHLALAANEITDVSSLGGLTNLTTLRLTFNAIMDVSSLERLTNLQYLDLRGNPLSVSSINDHVPALERNGVTVRFDRFRKGDFDIEVVFLGDFIEGQKNVLKYAARRWMSVITADLPDYEFTQGWSGTCGGQSIEIPSGERIDDLRIYVGSFEDAEGPSGYGGTRLLRESHLPIFGCMTFNSKPGYLQITAPHEVGHVLGFGRRIWGSLGFFQDPDGDQHFNGPLAIAAFDDAGGRDYSGKKVPVEGSHWRYSVLEGELMGPRGGEALSAITVQSMADLGYGVDVTEADAYTLPGAAAAQASANTTAAIASIPKDDRLGGHLASPTQVEPELWCSLDGEREPIYVVDQLGRIIRTMGN